MRKILAKFLPKKMHRGKLQPLSPHIIGGKNSYYVQLIKYAVKMRGVQNVALSGGYGTGKSSILEQYKRSSRNFLRKEAKTVSFLTMEIEDNVTPNSDVKAANRLRVQKEIFKQLFYGESPSKLRRSKYHRVGRTAGLLCASASAVIGFSLGYFYPLQKVFSIQINLQCDWYMLLAGTINAVFYSTACYAILAHIYSFMCDHPIKAIKIWDLSTDLADTTPEFEQMLDEIIYLFKKTKYKVLILEDLDRFKDPLIYEELRQLNLLINNSCHIRKKVTFIYALRDSLIINPENRAKIFDIVIPVAPFMSKDNSLDYVMRAFSESDISGNGADVTRISKVIARNIHDMRVIKSICNTSIVLNNTINDGRIIGLTVEKIIAIATIRELYPEEYEKMRVGDGSVDKLYALCDKKRQEDIESATDNLNDRIDINGVIAKAADDLWQDIIAPNGQLPFMSAAWEGNNAITKNELSDIRLWQRLLSTGNISLNITYRNSYGGQNTQQKIYAVGQIKSMTKNLERVVFLLSHDEEYYSNEVKNISNSDRFLNAKAIIADDAKIREVMSNIPVAREIIELGLLDELYRLYLSPFVDTTESCELRNFKINYLRNGLTDYGFRLSDVDIEKIMNESDEKDLSSVSFYNYSVFRWLIKRKDSRLNTIISTPSYRINELLRFYNSFSVQYRNYLNESYGDTIDGSLLEKGVLKSYADEREPILFLTVNLSKRYPAELMRHIVNNHRLGDSVAREVLFDVALISMTDTENIILADRKDELNPLDFLEYYEDYAIINGSAANLAKLYVANNRKVVNLARYKDYSEAFEHIVNSGMFILSKENIRVIGPNKLVSVLDKCNISEKDIGVIFSSSDWYISIKKYILSQIERYASTMTDPNIKKQIVQFMKDKKVPLAIEQITSLIGTFSASDVVSVLMTANLSRDDIILVLSKLPHPISKLAQPGTRPTINATAQNRRLVKKLQNFGMISNTEIRNNQIRIIMKKKF